jgi:hypothetical protein
MRIEAAETIAKLEEAERFMEAHREARTREDLSRDDRRSWESLMVYFLVESRISESDSLWLRYKKISDFDDFLSGVDDESA